MTAIFSVVKNIIPDCEDDFLRRKVLSTLFTLGLISEELSKKNTFAGIIVLNETVSEIVQIILEDLLQNGYTSGTKFPDQPSCSRQSPPSPSKNVSKIPFKKKKLEVKKKKIEVNFGLSTGSEGGSNSDEGFQDDEMSSDVDVNSDSTYQQEAESLLKNEFPWINASDIQRAFAAKSHNYTKTRRFLRDLIRPHVDSRDFDAFESLMPVYPSFRLTLPRGENELKHATLGSFSLLKKLRPPEQFGIGNEKLAAEIANFQTKPPQSEQSLSSTLEESSIRSEVLEEAPSQNESLAIEEVEEQAAFQDAVEKPGVQLEDQKTVNFHGKSAQSEQNLPSSLEEISSHSDGPSQNESLIVGEPRAISKADVHLKGHEISDKNEKLVAEIDSFQRKSPQPEQNLPLSLEKNSNCSEVLEEGLSKNGNLVAEEGRMAEIDSFQKPPLNFEEGPSRNESQVFEEIKEIEDFTVENKLTSQMDKEEVGEHSKMSQTDVPNKRTVVEEEQKVDMPLHAAAREGNIDQVRLLIDEGADMFAINESGNTALHEACGFGQLLVVEYLLKKGATISSRGEGGRYPLHMAAACGHQDIVRLLLDRGDVEIDAVDEWSGVTALHLASYFGREDIVTLLIEKGADKNATDSRGLKAIDAARSAGHHAIAQMLQI